MLKKVLAQRWVMFLAGAVVVIAILSMFVRVRIPGDWDGRPVASPEAIAELRERDDLNVLFIMVDTLRAERLGSYGNERDTSPVLDHLAENGVRFSRHLSQSSWTKSSMASLWTGLYPARTGIERYDDILPESAQMAAEILRDDGYLTVGLWRNGWVAPTFGFDQGFEVYQRPTPTPLPPNVLREKPNLSERGTDQSLIDVAVEFLRVNGNQRWFLYLHMMDLHEYMYDADSALFGSTHSDIYDNSILWTDGTIEILLTALDEMDLLDKTLIAIVSDHGEAFLERGFEGHARAVYRESTEVPFLLSLPFRLDSGIVVETRTQNVDVWPTIFDLLGLDAPSGIDGRSRVPEIMAAASGESVDVEGQHAVAALDQTWARREADPVPLVAIAEGDFRYVRASSSEGQPQEQLFNAADDPEELRNRMSEYPEVAERMRGLADDYDQSTPFWGEPPTRELDELELNLLRALGYKIE